MTKSLTLTESFLNTLQQGKREMTTPMEIVRALDDIAGELEHLQHKLSREFWSRDQSELKNAIARSKKEVMGASYMAEDAIDYPFKKFWKLSEN